MSTLEITTLIGCPLACTFCPQDTLVKNYGSTNTRILSLESFQKIIKKIPPHVRIDFSGMAEPFENPACIEMVRIASETNNPIAIYTTLSGLKKADAIFLKELIIKGRIFVFTIHLPDNTGNMRGFKYTEEYMKCLEILLPLDSVTCMTMSKNAQIDSRLLEIINNSTLKKKLIPKLPKNSFKGIRRAGSLNADKIDGQPLHDKVQWNCALICASTPFYDHNVLLPDGTVVLCGNDYGLKHKLGNLLDQSYMSLFSGEEMRKVKSLNMLIDSDKKLDSICTLCENTCTYSVANGHWVANTIPTASTKRLVATIASRIFNKLRSVW